MPVSKIAVAAMVGTALANPLTVIAPCTEAPGQYPDQTVTAQFQPVSYCVPTTTVEYSTHTSVGYGTTQTITDTTTRTLYPLASTSVYVSTVIPCAYDGTEAASSCTITTTDQNVECRETSTTVTSYKPYQTITSYPVTVTPTNQYYGYGNGTYHNATTTMTTKTTTLTETHYTTISKQYDAPYNQVGGWIIPGYTGAPICTNCGADAEGNKHQPLKVTDCEAIDSSSTSCSVYSETWVSKPIPASTSVASHAYSTQSAVTTGGTYTFEFPATYPSATYTAPATNGYPSSVVTAPGQTYTNTVTYTCPYEHQTPPGQKPTSTSYQPKPTSAYPTGGNGGAYPTGGNGGYPTSGNGGYPTGGNGGYPTTTSSGPSTPTGGSTCQFKLAVVDTNARFQKSHFVGFDGDDAIVSDGGSCAFFSFDGQSNLVTEEEYIATSGSSQYAPFEKTTIQPGSYNKYTFDTEGNLHLAGANGFCTQRGSILVVYGAAPYGCTNVNLHRTGDENCSTTTTTTTTTTSTYSTSTTTTTDDTTTTTTADISGDLVYEPTPTPTSAVYGHYKKRYVIRRGENHA